MPGHDIVVVGGSAGALAALSKLVAGLPPELPATVFVVNSYSADALADEQDDVLEKGCWAAFRALEENASLAGQLATRARRQGRLKIAERFTERAEEAQANADTVRRMILEFGSPTRDAVPQGEPG